MGYGNPLIRRIEAGQFVPVCEFNHFFSVQKLSLNDRWRFQMLVQSIACFSCYRNILYVSVYDRASSRKLLAAAGLVDLSNAATN